MITFDEKIDIRGALVAIEGNHDIPFTIKRVFYMYNIPQESIRGCHAHKDLQQVLICLNGICEIIMDDGFNKEKIVLNKRNIGLYIPPRIWHEIKFCSSNTILISLASEDYNESDYIRNYIQFKQEIANN